MPKVQVDFSDVKEFEALPKGEYDCVIEEAKFVEPTEDGKYPYINLTLAVTEEGEFEKRKLWCIWSLSPNALFRMKGDLENLGLVVGELDIDYDEDSMIVTSPEVVGLPVTASVSTRTYQGRTQNQVDVLRALGEPRLGSKTGTGGKKTNSRRTFK